MIVVGIVPVKGRKNMVAIETYAVYAGGHVLAQNGHRTAVAWNGGVVYLVLIFIVIQIVEMHSSISLAKIHTFAFGHGIHVWDEP
jgi:hypothetical protein